MLNCVRKPINDTYLFPALIALQIAVDVGTVDSTGKIAPCLVLSIKGLGTNVTMHPWDLTASASLSSLAVAEMTYGTEGGPFYLVQTPVGAELLSVKFVKVVIFIVSSVDAMLERVSCVLNSVHVAANNSFVISWYLL